MTSKVLRCFAAILVTATLAWGQTVANVTSAAPFTLRGAAADPTKGVPSFPAVANDTIKAGSKDTVVAFPDGSTLTLTPNSEARVEVVNGRPVFRLLSGEAHYVLKTLTAVTLAEDTKTVTPTKLTGTLGGSKFRSGAAAGGAATAATVGFWTGTNTALVLGAAGAAAGLGVGLTQALNDGTPVSPSR